MKKLAWLFFALSASCATVGTTFATPVAKDSPAQCQTYCTDMGLTLSAVVVMANNVGCVCKLAEHGDQADGAAAAAGGMAAILMAEEAERKNPKPGLK